MVSKDETSQSEPRCPNCLSPTPQDAHFCGNCDAPLTAHAATDPLGSIRAMGHAFRRGANRRPSRTVLVGMWLLFGGLFILNLPAVYYSLLALMSLFGLFSRISTDYGFFPLFFVFVFAVGLEVLCVVVLIRVTRNYRTGE